MCALVVHAFMQRNRVYKVAQTLVSHFPIIIKLY